MVFSCDLFSVLHGNVINTIVLHTCSGDSKGMDMTSDIILVYKNKEYSRDHSRSIKGYIPTVLKHHTIKTHSRDRTIVLYTVYYVCFSIFLIYSTMVPTLVENS